MIRKVSLSFSLALVALIMALVLDAPSIPSASGKPSGAQSLSTIYTQNFDSLANSGIANPWADDSTLAGWYAARAVGGTFTTYRADTGTSNAGALYSYGTTGAIERALGSVSSGTPSTIYYGLRMQNDTGANIVGVVITYTGEQWRQGGNTSQQKLAFAYQVGSVMTNVIAGTWTDVNQLDFVSPITASNLFTGALDGNVIANRVTLAAQLNVALAPNQEIMFRWMDINDVGNDHGLAVDDLSIAAIGAPPEADLALRKSGPTTASAGDSIAYTIELSNTGKAAATSTIVTDTFPAEVAFVTYTASFPVTFTPLSTTEFVWEAGDFAANSTLLIQVEGVVSPSVADGTLFTNTVTASTGYTETNLGNNSAAASTLIGAPDLAISKAGPATANAGDAVLYTLTYTNEGSLPATNVSLVDQLPAGLMYMSDSGASNVGANGVITWALGTLNSGQSNAIVLTATALFAGDQVNGVAISGLPLDSNSSNNTSIVTTTVYGVDPFVVTSGPAQLFGGDVVSYTITYGNAGNLPVDVTFTDTLPLSFTIVGDDSGLPAVDAANTRSWTTTIPANTTGLSFTLTVNVPLSIVSGTRVTNTVTVATAAAGNNSANDTAYLVSTIYQFTLIHDIQYVNDPDISDTSAYTGTWVAVQGVVIANPGSFLSASGLPYRYYIEDPAGGPWSGLYIYRGTLNPPGVFEGDFVRLYGLLTEFAQGGSQQTELDLSKTGAFQQVISTGNSLPAPFVLTTDELINAGTAEQWESVLIEFQKARVTNPNIGNGEWYFDDGTGAMIGDDNAKAGNNTVFTYVPQLNDHYTYIRGIGWQSFGTYKLEPRYNADVVLDYPVTFIYNDVEDVVQPGEDVQLRGDFNGWGSTPITMSADAGYTVFSATVTLPTTATQNYRYYVAALGGNTAAYLLNTNDRSFAPAAGVTMKNDYRNVVAGWGNLNGPASQTINLGNPTAVISGQLYVQEVTNPAGPGRGLKAEVGYGAGADPASWSWFGTTYLTNTSNNDVYGGVFTPTAGGVYSYATRYNGNWGSGNPNSMWVYADLDGIPFSLDQAGVLTVTAPQLSITKTVTTAHPIVNLGEIVTYTFTVNNSGDGVATGVLVTDVLPGEVTFGSFIAANGATSNGDVVSWSGSLNANAQVQVLFTATLGVNSSYLGRVVTNTVSLTANNAASQSASAMFKIATPPDLSESTKTSQPSGTVLPGALITYTIVLSNNGQTAATVLLTDVLNSYYTVSTVGDFTQSPAGTLKWSGTVAAGSRVTLFFIAQVNSLTHLPIGVTTLTNSATLNDGLHAPYTLTDAAPPRVTVHGLYLPLIKR